MSELLVDPAAVQIGSAHIAAIAGVSRWKKPLDVWAELMGYAEPIDNEQIRIGLALESAIAGLAYAQVGAPFPLVKGKKLFVDGEPWARATPDFEIGNEIIEAKNVGESPGPHGAIADWNLNHEAIVPDYVWTQVQWQMHVGDFGGAYVGALLGGRRMFVSRIERDREFGADLLEIGKQFREKHILKNAPPGFADGSEAFHRYLQKRYPKTNGRLIPATPDDEALLLRLRATELSMAELKIKASQVKQQLSDRIGENRGLLGASGRVLWYERKAYVVKEHTVEAGRCMKVKWPDEEEASQ